MLKFSDIKNRLKNYNSYCRETINIDTYIQCLVENVKYNNLVPKHGVCF